MGLPRLVITLICIVRPPMAFCDWCLIDGYWLSGYSVLHCAVFYCICIIKREYLCYLEYQERRDIRKIRGAWWCHNTTLINNHQQKIYSSSSNVLPQYCWKILPWWQAIFDNKLSVFKLLCIGNVQYPANCLATEGLWTPQQEGILQDMQHSIGGKCTL